MTENNFITKINLSVSTDSVNVALGVVFPGARPITASLRSQHAAPDFRILLPH